MFKEGAVYSPNRVQNYLTSLPPPSRICIRREKKRKRGHHRITTSQSVVNRWKDTPLRAFGSSLESLSAVPGKFHRFSTDFPRFSTIVPEIRERISLEYSSHRTVFTLALWRLTGKSMYSFTFTYLITHVY